MRVLTFIMATVFAVAIAMPALAQDKLEASPLGVAAQPPAPPPVPGAMAATAAATGMLTPQVIGLIAIGATVAVVAGSSNGGNSGGGSAVIGGGVQGPTGTR